jgi:hypothetical protein
MAFDPDAFLESKTTAGFDPDAFLAAKETAPEPAMVADIQMGVTAPGTPMTTPPDASAVPQLPVSGYGPGIGSQLATTGMGQTAAAMAQPYVRAGQNLIGQYAAAPMTKLAPDLAAMTMGMPPPIATSQILQATQQAGQAAMRSRVPPPAVPTFQSAPIAPAQVANNPMLAEMARLQAAAQTETLANRSMIQKIAMSKVMQMAAPALNTAARVAGPAGLAYNAYEAANMARDTQLGERLAAGQGGAAEQAFRQRNTVYGTNNSITADQARTILGSGNQRDIQAFGGTDFLRKRALGQ